MNTFIEKNKGLLKFYCVAARIIGWVLVLGGLVWFFLIIPSIDADISARADALLYVISSMLFDFMMLGLIALGVTQFIRYLSETGYQPGCILRKADRIFYMYAVFLILKTYCKYIWYNACYAELLQNPEVSRLLFMQPFFLPTLAKVLILVGLGQTIRRILPIIEESKTLV